MPPAKSASAAGITRRELAKTRSIPLSASAARPFCASSKPEIIHHHRTLRAAMTGHRIMRRLHLLIAVGVLILDRFSKRLVAKEISLHDSITVIKRVFYITHVENRGAAFGLFNDSPSEWKIALVVLFSIVALVIVAALLWRSSHTMTATAFGLSLILGGALGNLWDRLLNGRVVDFLLVYIGSYQWPAFNVADSAIVVGAGLLVFEILFAKTPEAEKTA